MDESATRESPQHATAMAAPRRRRWAWAYVAVVAFFLSLVWWRASPEHTLWVDEVHSLQLVQLPVERLLDESARDFHPPGYALALKAWLKVGRALGLEPGVAWARSLNVLVWLLTAGLTAFLGAKLLGSAGGLLLTAGVAGSAAAAVVVRDLRSYGFAFGALTVAALLLAWLLDDGRAATERRRWTCWAACSAALTVALWSHLLAAPAVALLALAWLALALARRTGRPCLLAGMAAQAVPWLLFLPWLLRVPGQVAGLRRAAPDWMTPATLGNLLRVFDWWVPLGRISPPSPAAAPWLTLLGAVSVALPLALAVRAAFRHRAAGPAATLAWLALPVAVGSILFYWALARLGLLATFHGPRHPLLVAGILVVGLVAGALAGTRGPGRAALVLAPWLLAGLVGQGVAIQQERSGLIGLQALRRHVETQAPRPGGEPVLYVMPSELAPFVRETFAGFRQHPVEDLLCEPPREALVLAVNPWSELDRARDQVVGHALRSGLLAAETVRSDHADVQIRAIVHRLHGIDTALARELCARGGSPLPTAPADAVSVAAPEDQLAGDGWSFLELSPRLDAWRWAARETVRLRFDRPLAAGTYALHVRGVRQPYPEETVTMGLELRGSDLDVEIPVPAGPFDLSFTVQLRRPGAPVLTVRHPTWSPASVSASGDTRQLSFMLDAAWLEASPP